MRLVRYNPLSEYFWGNTFDNFFNDSIRTTERKSRWNPPVDIHEHEDHVELLVELPGLKKEDISVKIEDKLLTIEGERKLESDDSRDNYCRRERFYGKFKRSFTLSENIMIDDVSADFKDGVLNLHLKKDVKKDEVKQIPIH